MRKKSNHLNECLERIRHGDDLENCLKDYPEETDELRPLLQTALGITKFAMTAQPRPEFIAQTQTILEQEYYFSHYSWKARIAGWFRPKVRLAKVTAVSIVILGLVFAGGFSLSIVASEDAMPGQILYPIKLATEQVRLFFTFSDDGKVGYLTEYAETRAAEIVYAIEQGDDAHAEAALERLERHLDMVERIAGPGNTPRAMAASEHESLILQEIETIVNESLIDINERILEIKTLDSEKKEEIIDRIEKAYTVAIESIESARAESGIVPYE